MFSAVVTLTAELFMCFLHKQMLSNKKSKRAEYEKNDNLLNLCPPQIIRGATVAHTPLGTVRLLA